ncbi:MAG: hypothetical protein HY560_02455 [Gemmatimonadetes bacterium]|nr:hypothetical protein [Gemmatimonadota bacterium]
MIRLLGVTACLTGLPLLTLPSAGAAQAEAPAVGFAVWVRAPGRSIQDLAGSAVGAPQFAIGVRRDRVALGVGVGLSLVRSSDEDSFAGSTTEQRIDVTAFQLGPSGLLDIWRSVDGRVRGQLAGGFALGRVSVTETDVFSDPSGTQRTVTKTSGTLLGFHAALGGEYFLHPHFALGVEAGFQGNFTLGLQEKGTNQSFSVGANGAYGALRAMIVR